MNPLEPYRTEYKVSPERYYPDRGLAADGRRRPQAALKRQRHAGHGLLLAEEAILMGISRPGCTKEPIPNKNPDGTYKPWESIPFEEAYPVARLQAMQNAYSPAEWAWMVQAASPLQPVPPVSYPPPGTFKNAVPDGSGGWKWE